MSENLRYSLVRDFLAQVNAEALGAQPGVTAPQAMPPGGAGVPQANPAAPPQSNLIQNVPGAA